MLQSNIKQIRLKDLLSVKNDTEISTVEVIQILALCYGRNQEQSTYTVNVDSVSMELFKQGNASVEVTGKDGNEWLSYTRILQKADQPSFISFVFDRIKRFCKKNFVFSI